MENTMNVKEATNAHDEHQNGLAVPEAKRVPKERTFHGDTFIDNYEWLRDKESQDVRDYVAAENRYCEQRMAPLKTLRETLFEEFKSHVQETDMSVPTRMDGYWYFTRTTQGEQYAVQCRVPIRGADDWDPPTVEAGVPLDGEQVVFDTNAEAQGHDFFRVGGMDISKDGRWMLYGTDTSGDERYDFRIRDLETGDELEERFEGIGGACFTPDAQWVFYVLLDDAWRPYAVMRHHVGTPVADDVEVYREADERFWVGIGLSFDERNIVIGTGSKTTTEVLMLPVDTPEGSFRAFIPRETDVEYDVSFACFEGAGEHGEDIPLAVVYHNALNPNFEIDVIDMRTHEPPYRLGEGVRVAVGSPYGCEHGDDVDPGASSMPIGTPYSNPCNPAILQGAHGLGIEGISIHRHFVALQYRAESLPHIAVMTNLAPNHLDVHKDMDEYIAAKENIYLHQHEGDIAIFNEDNDITRSLSKKASARTRLFSRREEVADGAFLRGDTIVLRHDGCEEAVMQISDIRLPGMHNVENYLAAVTALDGLVPYEVMRETARTFVGVEHRIEPVRTIRGVQWYNDSIASSPTRTIAGLNAFNEKVILLAGGYDKHIPFAPLAPEVVKHVKLLILCGATADAIEKAVRECPDYHGSPEIVRCESLEDCVKTAYERAVRGDIVTLSPACAAFDQFANFMERGKAFKKLVMGLGE